MSELENIDFEHINKIWEAVQKAQDYQIPPGIVVGGKTGVGKSSLLNSILGKKVYETGVIPTTIKNDEQTWSTNAGDIRVIDVPGFGEAGYDEKYKDNMFTISAVKAHIFLLILKSDDRALDHEQKFLLDWQSRSELNHIQLLVVINQIDKMNPVREWKPKEMNLKVVKTQKEKNIREYLDYISRLKGFDILSGQGRMIAVSAGEENTPIDELYGIEELKIKIYNLLPEAAKTLFARHAELKSLESKRIIRNYSLAVAGAVTVNFMPASDFLVIAPIQIAMIIHLGNLHGLTIDKVTVSGLLTSIGMSFAGRFTAQGIVSFLPFIKNIVGPPLAFSLTYAMGLTVNELFSDGKVSASQEEFKKYANRFTEEAKNESKNFKH